MIKKILIIVLLFVGLRVSAQNPVTPQWKTNGNISALDSLGALWTGQIGGIHWYPTISYLRSFYLRKIDSNSTDRNYITKYFFNRNKGIASKAYIDSLNAAIYANNHTASGSWNFTNSGGIGVVGVIGAGGGIQNSGNLKQVNAGIVFESSDPLYGWNIAGGEGYGFGFHNAGDNTSTQNWHYVFNNSTGDWITTNPFLGLNFRTLTTRDLVSGGGTIATKDSTLQVNKNLYDLANKTTARTNLSVSNKNNFINALDLGAIADGTTDNASIINTALATYPNIYFPNGTYYLSTAVQLNNGQNIWGSGNKTVFKITADTAAINVTASGFQIRDIKILGSGRGTGTNYATTKPHQNGIKITGTVLNGKIINFSSDSCANAGIRVGPKGSANSYPGEGVTIVVPHISHSLYGILFDKLSEYNNVLGAVLDKNQYGAYVYGGNNKFVAPMIDSNRTGFKPDSGSNDGHSVLDGGAINHNLDYGIDVGALTNGYLITNCMIYFNKVRVTGANNVKFTNNFFKTDSLILNASVNTVFENNLFVNTPPLSFTNGYTARFFNNTYTLGVVPSTMAETTSTDIAINGHAIINGNTTGTNAYYQLKANGASIGYFGSDAAITAGALADVDTYVNGNHNWFLYTNNNKRITVSGAGAIAFPAGTYSGASGLIHAAITTGALTNSLLVNADITNATIDLTTKVTGITPVVNGGNGQSTYTNGQLLIGNTTGNTLTKATLTAGNGVSVTNSTGSITLAADTSVLVSKTFAGRYATINGSPTFVTQAQADNSTKAATTAYVDRVLIDNVLSKTANYTIVSGDFAVGKKATLDLYVDATIGNTTITLPSAATFKGYTIYVTKTDVGVNIVTVNTVSGLNTLVSQYQERQFNSDGTNWYNH